MRGRSSIKPFAADRSRRQLQGKARARAGFGVAARRSTSLERPTDFPAATTQIERPKSASVAGLPLRFMKKINIIESNSAVAMM